MKVIQLPRSWSLADRLLFVQGLTRFAHANGKLACQYVIRGSVSRQILAIRRELIVDVLDSVTTTAASLAVNAAGAVRFKTIVLITPEEVDAAVQKSIRYRRPGQ